MQRITVIVLCVVLVGYAGLCLAMFLYQRSLLYYPQPRGVTTIGSTMTLPVDGAALIVSTLPHDGPKAIVYFGGNGEDVSQNLDSFAKAFPDHALYLMHYRSYGGSTGKPTEKDNVADAIALTQKVRAVHPEIAVIGRSLGSGVAVQVASRMAVSRLVLVTPYDSIVEIAAETYPFVPVRWLMRDTYDSGRFAPAISIPTTVIEAEHDEQIPHASTAKLLTRFAPGIATLTVIEGVGHNDLGRNKTYRETLQAALR